MGGRLLHVTMHIFPGSGNGLINSRNLSFHSSFLGSFELLGIALYTRLKVEEKEVK